MHPLGSRVFLPHLLPDVRVVRIRATKALENVDSLADVVLINQLHRSVPAALLGICLGLASLEAELTNLSAPRLKEEYKFTGYELVETLLDNLRVLSMPTPRVAKDKLREACI
jgi:hypothetical protein